MLSGCDAAFAIAVPDGPTADTCALIELAGHGSPPASAPPFPGALWLQVRDVYATQAELEGRGVDIARAAKQEPWGLHEMHVTDPDGVALIFVQVPETHPLRRDTRQ